MTEAATPYRVGAELARDVIVTTGNEIEGHRVERYLGVVRGIVVRSPSIGQSFLGGFKQLVGGNIEAYAQVCEAARHEAYARMLGHAKEIGAQAIVGMRYDATEFAAGVTEVLAYGTAVTISRSV
ncbi:MAG: YbjQ family protein [Polyangia bacterium]